MKPKPGGIKYFTTNTTVTLWEKQASGGFGWSEAVPVKVDISIDFDDLYQRIARQALKNKSGKTKMLNGIVIGNAWRITPHE